MIPKFSIKHILLAMVVLGIFFLFLSSAARGNRIAFGLSVATAAAIIPFIAYAAVHWFSFAIAFIPIPGFQAQSNQGVLPNPIESNSIATNSDGTQTNETIVSEVPSDVPHSLSNSIAATEIQSDLPPDNELGLEEEKQG